MKKKNFKILERLSALVYEQNYEQLKVELETTEMDISQFNDSEHTLLHIAAKVKHSGAIINLLVEKGIDVNILDKCGNTPLLDSVLYGCPENLKLLIQLGGDIEKENFENDSPLSIACSDEYFDCVQLLIKHGAKINKVSPPSLTGSTPLRSAIYYAEDLDLVKYLVENGADINLNNPIMAAISVENIEILEYLIENGVELDKAKNRNGEDVFAFAQRVGNKEIIAMLTARKDQI